MRARFIIYLVKHCDCNMQLERQQRTLLRTYVRIRYIVKDLNRTFPSHVLFDCSAGGTLSYSALLSRTERHSAANNERSKVPSEVNPSLVAYRRNGAQPLTAGSHNCRAKRLRRVIGHSFGAVTVFAALHVT